MTPVHGMESSRIRAMWKIFIALFIFLIRTVLFLFVVFPQNFAVRSTNFFSSAAILNLYVTAIISFSSIYESQRS
jgi:hypothetical protein